MATVLVERPSPSECGHAPACIAIAAELHGICWDRCPAAATELILFFGGNRTKYANITSRAEGSTEAGFVVVRPGQAQQVELKIGQLPGFQPASLDVPLHADKRYGRIDVNLLTADFWSAAVETIQ